MTHWKKLTNPDYLGVYALDDGKDIILTIKSVGREMVTGTDGKKEECTVAHFSENVKPMILNSTNMKMIAKHYGNYIEGWIGKKIQIGSEKVKAFGEIVEALRVRNKLPSDNSKKYYCEQCKSEIVSFGGRTPEALSNYTKEKFGMALCSGCAMKAAEQAKNEIIEKVEKDAGSNAEKSSDSAEVTV